MFGVMHKIWKTLFILSNVYIALLVISIMSFGNLINEQYCKPNCQRLENALCYKVKSRPIGELVKCKEFIGSTVISGALSLSGNFFYSSMFAIGSVIYEPSVVLKKPMVFIVLFLLWSPIIFWLTCIVKMFKGSFKYA